MRSKATFPSGNPDTEQRKHDNTITDNNDGNKLPDLEPASADGQNDAILLGGWCLEFAPMTVTMKVKHRDPSTSDPRPRIQPQQRRFQETATYSSRCYEIWLSWEDNRGYTIRYDEIKARYVMPSGLPRKNMHMSLEIEVHRSERVVTSAWRRFWE
ncbi:hypothetical protein H072_1559 [Dactylellina haptotyla CBS 200.50]|uniref:Uncharacterized protein n=1 Tax=Dactylellina haptotyla (strain CBS 200.50) TaxID=1284197 RepID=S8BY85_DACHA|nr:hypothetical protein H072_1559 [Dactylellina haptotyla CBS 200.50]